MIKIINRNILDCTEDIIVHQVNVYGAMGAGVAKQLEPNKAGSTFVDMMFNTTLSFESITRARRAFFKQYPELRDTQVEKIRKEEEEQYRTEYGHIPTIN